MKHKALHAALAAIALSLSACTGTEADILPEGAAVPVAIHTRSTSGNARSTSSTARLLLWHDTNFHREVINPDNPVATPLYTSAPEREIDYYTYAGHFYYELPYIYPLDGQRLHAMGYAPDAVLTPTPTGRVGDYSRLTVDEGCRDGGTDLLVCDGSAAHSATSTTGDTFLDEQHELLFRHLTAKLTFLGERDRDMYGLVGVRNVRIAITACEPGLIVPAELKLYVTKGADNTEDRSTYIMDTHAEYPYGTDSVKYADALPVEPDRVEMGARYVLTDNFTYGTAEQQFNPFGTDTRFEKADYLGAWVGDFPQADPPRLQLTVKAEIYNSEAGSGYDASVEGTWETREVVWDTDYLTGDMFLPGYEYRIILHFDRVGIAIRAEAVPWNSEELHEYPVHPLEPPTE